MKYLGKTVYLTTEGTYIHCEDSTITFEMTNGVKQSIAYNAINNIVIFYNTTLSTYLMYYCSKYNIVISYISSLGQYRGCFIGNNNGNVLLRKKQFEMLNTEKSLKYVQNLIGAKIYNSIWLLKYFAHHNEYKDDILKVVDTLQIGKSKVKTLLNIDEIRILEANMAMQYYSCFDKLLKVKDTHLLFEKRSKRPPLNACNALLSLLYTLTTTLCESALLVYGLDSECGFMHALRAGRHSLACDLVEEFRSCVVDRFVITILNRKEIEFTDFEDTTEGFKLTKDGKKKLFTKWEHYLNNTEINHKLYDKKLTLKLIIYEQAQLLAQYVREDISEYPPFLYIQ